MRSILFLIALFMVLCGKMVAGPYAVYLTWQKDPTTTMTIQWISEKGTMTSLIEYKEEGAVDWKSDQGSARDLPQKVPYKMHVVELQNLQPNTKYCFRFHSKGKIRRFCTMPKTLEKPITFVVGGDTSHGGVEVFKETNRLAAKTDPSFAILGGDLAYACEHEADRKEDSKEWLHWIRAYSDTMVTQKGYLIPLLVCIGNHDVSGSFGQKPENARFFYCLFVMPGLPGYNTLRFSNYLSLYLLDSNHTNPIKGAQSKWLACELAKDQQMQNRFAVYHVPAYPSRRSLTSEPTATIRKYWVPIFEEYNLHAAFENHDHNYKRTYPLREGKMHPKGVVYIGDGSWGAKPQPCAKNPHKAFIASFHSVRQFLKVELSEKQRTFTAIDSKGKVIDQYVQEVR